MTLGPQLALALLVAAPSPGPESSPRIPLRAGLVVVTALASPEGDYESIKSVKGVDESSVRLTYTADRRGGSAPSRMSAARLLSRSDLESSHVYMRVFSPNLPERFPGTTGLGASRAVLDELKKTGKTLFAYRSDPGRSPDPMTLFAALRNQGSGPNLEGMDDAAEYQRGTLERLDPPGRFPVLVNGQRAELPVIRARGRFPEGESEFVFLDDPDNPLALRFALASGTQLEVVRLSFPGNPMVEQQLRRDGHSDVYGIYFDFGSDRLRDESEPVLSEIAEAMAGNPGWKLEVAGHTDNVGGDGSNLELSKRRAAAVKKALVSRYHVNPDRLSTNGYGVRRPKATNDSPQGRALNRRVELVRSKLEQGR